jgi:hypothetical protein
MMVKFSLADMQRTSRCWISARCLDNANGPFFVFRKCLSGCQLRTAVATRAVSSHFRNVCVLTEQFYRSDGIARSSFFDYGLNTSPWACLSRCQADYHAFKPYLRVNLIIGMLLRISTTLFKNTNCKKKRNTPRAEARMLWPRNQRT